MYSTHTHTKEAFASCSRADGQGEHAHDGSAICFWHNILTCRGKRSRINHHALLCLDSCVRVVRAGSDQCLGLWLCSDNNQDFISERVSCPLRREYD